MIVLAMASPIFITWCRTFGLLPTILLTLFGSVATDRYIKKAIVGATAL
jgi:hypothetical protein